MPRGPDGIKMIYGTNKANPQSWYFQGQQDSRMKIRANGGTFIANPDGSYSLSQNTDVFLAIETNDKSGIIGINQLTSSARGFMRNIRDWNNVEIHIYAFIPSEAESDPSITVTMHGADPYAQFPNTCLGTGYTFTFFKSGATRFGKALWYPSGFLYTEKKNKLTDLGGRWIGFKIICVTLGPGKVKLEVFVDETNVTQNWRPFDSITDSGGWGGQGLSLDPELVTYNACNGTSDQVLDYGGPIIAFSWRNMPPGFSIKNLGIREINPKNSYVEPAVQEGSGLGSQSPKFGVQPERDSQFYGDSENFATEDRPGT